MGARTIKLTIAALGGQGGGVLTDWLIALAESNGYIVQATSVPGVAQRTGATIYYLEFFARDEAVRHGRDPVMALMPVAGDVDCLVAAELAEAGRAIQRGLVSATRTTLIASTHRSYAIGEKSALAGTLDSQALLELVRAHGKRSILFDMEATAQRHHSLISAVLLGAICGAGVLPFGAPAFEEAIRAGGLAVDTNLKAFADARAQAEQGGAPAPAAPRPRLPESVPQHSRSPRLQPLLERVHGFPTTLQPLVLAGVRRTLDYQDPQYAELYLTRLTRIAALESHAPAGSAGELTEATGRSLALWMTFEDTIRVADLKTRAARFERVRAESGAPAGQLLGITEFMRPRVAEIAGTLPARLGSWIERSPRATRLLEPLTRGRQIRTSTVSGFLLLYTVAGLRRWRRGSRRYQIENARIEEWLGRIAQLARDHYPLAVELARAQRLVKGYGETHERGWRSFSALTAALPRLASRPDGAQVLSRLQQAALADEDGKALAAGLAGLTEPAGGAQAQRAASA